jgi:hypothetical protein
MFAITANKNEQSNHILQKMQKQIKRKVKFRKSIN